MHCCSITIAKTWKQPKSPSTDEWTKKNWYMYRRNISQGKKGHNVICSTVDESTGNHATCSKSERERHILYGITYRCCLKIDTSEDISTEKGNHRFIKQTYGLPMERCEDSIHSVIGVKRLIQTQVKYIITKNLRNTKRRLLNILS